MPAQEIRFAIADQIECQGWLGINDAAAPLFGVFNNNLLLN
jgi:hypothetical protein